MQKSVIELVKLGVFPKSEDTVKDPNGTEHVDKVQMLIDSIQLPVSNEEAAVRCSILGTEEGDDYFGLIQVLLQKIETAPDWPIKELFIDNNNYWMKVLKSRARYI